MSRFSAGPLRSRQRATAASPGGGGHEIGIANRAAPDAEVERGSNAGYRERHPEAGHLLAELSPRRVSPEGRCPRANRASDFAVEPTMSGIVIDRRVGRSPQVTT
jgi:hypothetical protein